VDFDHYVRAHRPALLRFAMVLTGQSWLADDVVSDVLGRAFERWDRIGDLAEPHAYLRRMVVNDYLSWRRRLARTAPRADVELGGEHVADGAQEHAERDEMIRRLTRLPRRQRTAVVLRYYAGLSDPDIAAQLGCRESTVRSQISRALTALRLDLTSTPQEHACPTSTR
jgi:RNA polymerase sigma-70 factor (sigma-E family)